MGVLAYHTYDRYHYHISRWSEKAAFFLLAILVIFLSFRENPKLDGILVLPVFFALIVAIAAEPVGMISKTVDSSPLRWLGRISYSIYMTHYMVLMFLSRCVARIQSHFNLNDRNAIGLAFVFLAIGLVLFISHLTYQWIEKPFQKEFRGLSEKHLQRLANSRAVLTDICKHPQKPSGMNGFIFFVSICVNSWFNFRT